MTDHIQYLSFPTKPLEYFGIAQEILELQKKGVELDKIAILCTKHEALVEMSKFLLHYDIPINYEKQTNILDHKLIKEIIDILAYIESLYNMDEDQKEYLLPTILNFEFWGIDPFINYKVAKLLQGVDKVTEDCILKTNNIEKLPKKWIELAYYYPDSKLKEVVTFLMALAKQGESLSANEILDYIIGNKSLNTFTSPYKTYYFKNINDPEYLTFLNYLATFVNKFRAFNQTNSSDIHAILNFVNLHRENKIPVNSTIQKSENTAVHLITAHGAKGLEWDYVYLLNTNARYWLRKNRSSKISLPVNLPFSPEKDNSDDKLRLFFVAITRAKTYLKMCTYRTELDGKDVEKLEFLSDYQPVNIDNSNQNNEALDIHYRNNDAFIINEEMKSQLEPILRNYQLSVTHLNNFVNLMNNGGPYKFLETNLLRFPQAKNPHASFGTAMHGALRKFYWQYQQTNSLPSLNDLQNYFVSCLIDEKLNPTEFEKWKNKGLDNLNIYYQKNLNIFSPNVIIEQNFKQQGCILGSAKITGAIDKMVINRVTGKIMVTDFKTGKSFDNLSPEFKKNNESLDNKKIKYARQLVFYKIMLENSRDFNQFIVDQGQLEFLQDLNLDEENIITKDISMQEVEELKILIQVVYKKIKNLDFPSQQDLEKYKNEIGEFDLNSNVMFLQDLIKEGL